MMYANDVHHSCEEITFQTTFLEYPLLLSMGKPYLTILNKLPDRFRFRYLKEGSHGGPQPVVKLHNCDDPSNIYIKASLYTNEVIPRLHDNCLFGNHCNDGVCWVKLSEDCTAEFPLLPILKKKEYEVIDILKQRILEKHEQDEGNITDKNLKKKLKNEYKTWINYVKICFEAFYHKDENYPVCEKIFSKTIEHAVNEKVIKLNISRLSQCSGKTSGNEDIILLCEKINKDDTEIVFFSLDNDQNVDWEAKAEFNQNDVHHQVAICFKTPPFKDNIEKTVFIKLHRKSDGMDSNIVNFYYKPCHELDPNIINQQAKKRKILDENIFTAPSTSFSGTGFGNLDGYCESKSPLSMFSVFNGKDAQFSNGGKPSDELTDEQHEDFDFYSHFFPGISEEVIPEGLIDNMASLNITEKTSDVILTKSCSLVTELEEILKNRLIKLIKGCRKDTFFKFLPLLLAFKDEKENNLLHLSIIEESENISLLLMMLKYAPDDLINQVNKLYMTPLLIAVSKKLWRIAKILLKFGANPNIKDKNGNNCVHLAAMLNFPFCMREILASLLGDPTLKYIPDINGLNCDGLAPLHLSIISHSEICTKLLLQANAAVNVTDGKSGKTPLHFAYERRSELVALLLAQPEIDPNAKDYSGNIPISCRPRTPNNFSPIIPESNEIPLQASSKSKCSEEKKQIRSSIDEENHINQNENAFCLELDSNGLWKKLALYIMDEKEVSTVAIMDCNPTKTILNQLKKHHGDKYDEQLKLILKDKELKQYAELLHL